MDDGRQTTDRNRYPVVRWGILGNAMIGRVCVVPAIAKAHNGEVAVVGSRSVERARELTAEHGGRAVAGYEAVLADPTVDAVYIPLPNQLHREWTLKALAAGKHVLVEKPFAMNASEAADMVAAAKEAGLHLMEAFMWRFHPRSQRIQQLVAAGELGNVGAVRAAFSYPTTRDGSNERLFSAEYGGGSLMDVGSYGVSVARWMLGEEPISAAAQAVYNEDGIDINFMGTLRFASDALALVECGFLSSLQQTYAILGDRAAIELPEQDAFVPWDKDAQFSLRRFDAEHGELITVDGADEYQLMVEHFADVVLGEAEPLFSAEDSLHQMQALDALAKAARSGKTIYLGDDRPQTTDHGQPVGSDLSSGVSSSL